MSEEYKKLLEERKKQLETELSGFATQDPNVKGDWDSKFPKTPEGNIEEAADEVEEYTTRVHLEFNLEKQLRDVNEALEKVEKGTYGICDSCGKKISEDRLKASPEAKKCIQCNQ